MGNKYSKTTKSIKLDAGVSHQITDSNNNDDLCSDDNKAHGSSHSDNTRAKEISSDASDDDEFYNLNRKKFSCYDVINSEWLKRAVELHPLRIYVHQEILEWIVSFINENILNVNMRATVKEVFHHNLNGQVYLIKFYTTASKPIFDRVRTTFAGIGKLTDQLKYKCVWEKRPIYFLKIDSVFDEQKDQIMSELQKLNLHESIQATSLDVNWTYIPKIEKYEFPEYLTDDQTNQIDLIFKNKSQSLSSLFICEQFEWHKDDVVRSYVDVDTLAMDICAKEWNRHDLLKEFDLGNIIDLDLAYKDYRNEFSNGYMEKYIHKLFLKLMPKLSSDYAEKEQISLRCFEPYEVEYFVSKFYNKLIFSDFETNDSLLRKHDIPKHDTTSDELSMMKHNSIIVYSKKFFNRKKFSCYDVINSEWLESARELDDNRIYVHQEILDWIVSFINENILNVNMRATVEEVFHHNLNGQVYLIKFYTKASLKTLEDNITNLTEQLKYKCVWEKRPTYFLKIDSQFNEQKDQIMSALQKLNLHESIQATSLDVNWMYIPEIERYEFPEYLTNDQTNEIDSIFKSMSQCESSLFICEQFEWHKDNVVGSYVDVDTLAMDICCEEWSRHDLLKEFDLENILALDLAYKDYRNEFSDEYMEKYIHDLLLKLMPKLSSKINEKMGFSSLILSLYATEYFLSKFYNKISFWENYEYYKLLSKHDIEFNIDTKEVDLELNKPTPEELSMMEHYSIIQYKISNYNFFSDSLFRTLLNKSNEKQTYIISFYTDFQFRYENDNKISPQLCSFGRLSIKLIDCTEKNAEQLAKFMKYLLNLSKEIHNPNSDIDINFINCVLDDYSFLESIDRSIGILSFTKMNLPSSLFKLLSRVLSPETFVYFDDCNITDTDVMTLLEKLNLNKLGMGLNIECTPAVLFLVAEHLMTKKSDIKSIKASRFSDTKGLRSIFRKMNLNPRHLEFFNTGDQIIIRDIFTKKIKSLFYTTEQNSDDESFDPIYNIYDE